MAVSRALAMCFPFFFATAAMAARNRFIASVVERPQARPSSGDTAAGSADLHGAREFSGDIELTLVERSGTQLPVESEATSFTGSIKDVDETLLQSEFNVFKKRFGKVYGSFVEDRKRLEVFADNWRMIAFHNVKKSTYKLEVNEFADLTWEEFKVSRLAAKQNCSAQQGSSNIMLSNPQLPLKRDWRAEGIVSPVKNQGHCGSCWTFSTTGALEAAYTKKTGLPANFSEQQLVDCAGAFNNFGCGGGLPSQAFEYIIYNGGIDTEEAYPYSAKDGDCHFSADGVGATVIDVVNITQYDEVELQGAVGLEQPVSIAFEVVRDFRFYKSGVYQSDACHGGADTVNHAVLAVGYDASADPPYWIIKNSWGATWGDEGYFKMTLGVNMCGISACCSYPVV